MTKNLDYIYLPQPKDQKNYKFVQKYEYRHSIQDYNNIAPSHKTHSSNPVTRTWNKWNIQNYVQDLSQSVCRADESKLIREHIRYIKNNGPRSIYALHTLNCRHDYGNIDGTMTLLKQINSPTLLLPYEQMYIKSLHHNNELIPEQHLNEDNPMFDLLHSNTTGHNPPEA